MIVDTIEHLPFYTAQIPGAGRIAEAFESFQPEQASVEVREKSYNTKPDEKRRFEVHFRTIDLMIARNGAEIIHVCPVSETQPAEFLPDGADGRKLDGEPKGSAILLEAGYFCAIFPGEAHMVGGHPYGRQDSIEKWVVKVPAPESFCTQAAE